MSSGRRVILFLPSFETGGVERNAVLFANGMLQAGHDVDLLYIRSVPGFFDRLDARVRKVKVRSPFRLPMLHPRLVDALNILLFSHLFFKSLGSVPKPVMVAFQSGVVAIALGSIWRIPIIARLSNHPSSAVHERSRLRHISEWAKRIAYRRATKIVANSVEMASAYSVMMQRNVEVVPNPIDPIYVRNQALKQLPAGEWPSDRLPVVISVGRLAKQKNFPMLVAAIGYVNAQTACRLVIVGEGEDRERIEKAVEDCGLQGRVHLLGYRENIYPYIAKADLFALSSDYEGLPNVLLEALALDKPIVSTRCPSGPAEILLDGIGGELVPPGDSHAMAEAIVRVLINPVEAQSKKAIATQHLAAYSLPHIMQKYDALIRNSQ